MDTVTDDDEKIRNLTQFDITHDEWVEIKRIAIKIHDSGICGKDQLKCAVHAFVQWLSMQENEVFISSEQSPMIH